MTAFQAAMSLVDQTYNAQYLPVGTMLRLDGEWIGNYVTTERTTLELLADNGAFGPFIHASLITMARRKYSYAPRMTRA